MKDCTLHHIGYVVADIQDSARQFAQWGYQAGEILFDKDLQVELCYLTKAGDTPIELVHQLRPDSLEAGLLQAQGVMPYHLAFASVHFDETCRELEAKGYKPLFTPVPVQALGGTRICYFHHPALGYIELLDA